MSLGGFGRDMLAEAARIAQQTVAREGTHLRWATVTEVDPLRIRYDGEPNPSIVTPQNTVANLNIGDRVQVGKQHGQATIIGRAGGSRPEYRIASGRININPSANSATGATVTFPAGRFTATPRAWATPVTSVIGTTVRGVSTGSHSSTSMQVYVYRTNTTSTGVDWGAIQA